MMIREINFKRNANDDKVDDPQHCMASFHVVKGLIFSFFCNDE
jgi:hypothetical protein